MYVGGFIGTAGVLLRGFFFSFVKLHADEIAIWWKRVGAMFRKFDWGCLCGYHTCWGRFHSPDKYDIFLCHSDIFLSLLFIRVAQACMINFPMTRKTDPDILTDLKDFGSWIKKKYCFRVSCGWVGGWVGVNRWTGVGFARAWKIEHTGFRIHIQYVCVYLS
jgi:hypothetical protein